MGYRMAGVQAGWERIYILFNESFMMNLLFGREFSWRFYRSLLVLVIVLGSCRRFVSQFLFEVESQVKS
jgi:hypothetical protein